MGDYDRLAILKSEYPVKATLQERARAVSCRPVISIGVVTEHEVLGEGLRAILGRQSANDVTLVGRVLDDAQRVGTSTDVLVVEASLLAPSPRFALTDLAQACPSAAVLVVCRRLEAEHAHLLLAAGAHGVVPMTACADAILAATACVSRGSRFVPDELRAAVTERMLDDGDPRFLRLSERELEVFDRLAEGLTAQQIADDMFLSVSTVRKHLQNSYGKLGVHGRTAALREFARLNGSAA
jgi:DNA-binding NarL/FixJ family response regulator